MNSIKEDEDNIEIEKLQEKNKVKINALKKMIKGLDKTNTNINNKNN